MLEKEPEVTLDVKCPECKYSMKLGAANTILVLFEKALPMSFLKITCQRPQCENKWFTFIDDDYEDVKRIIKHILTEGWPLQPEQEVPDWVREEWEENMECKLVEQTDLSPRHEAEIAKFSEVLNSTPDELLQDLFAHPPPKSTLPLNWKD